jgi:SAM-dependent methyltransferase
VITEPKKRWQKPDSGARYVGERWKSARRAGRDPRLVGSILAGAGGSGLILDVPCGTGRLREAIEGGGGRWVGMDVSASMLAASGIEEGPLLRGNAERLPFRDASFDAVVCCRLLHHLRDEESFGRVAGELVRVSRGLVIVSFWDAGSLPALRRRVFPRRRRGGRIAHPKQQLREVFEAAGAEVVGWRHSLRFFSRQTFAVVRKNDAVAGQRGAAR